MLEAVRRGEWRVSANGYKVSCRDHEKCFKISGTGCTTLDTQKPLNYTLKKGKNGMVCDCISIKMLFKKLNRPWSAIMSPSFSKKHAW